MANRGRKPGQTYEGRHACDEALALALASGMTIAKAAEAAGVSPRTAQRRREQPGFQALVRTLRKEMYDRAGGVLACRMSEAAECLYALFARESSPDQVKIAAARAFIELGLKVRDQVETAERVEELERAVGIRPPQDGKGEAAKEG